VGLPEGSVAEPLIFFTVSVPVLTFDKLRFRFWFRLLSSYRFRFRFPAPYLDHKKQSFQKKFWKKSCLFTN
jgi:hypothetical protein